MIQRKQRTGVEISSVKYLRGSAERSAGRPCPALLKRTAAQSANGVSQVCQRGRFPYRTATIIVRKVLRAENTGKQYLLATSITLYFLFLQLLQSGLHYSHVREILIDGHNTCTATYHLPSAAMGLVERESVAAASPTTIWNTCFAHMKWDIWDPDVERIEDVDEVKGLVEGTTATFVMKKESGGGKLPIVVIDLEQYKKFTFKGSIMGGLLKFTGKITLEEKSENETLVNYAFGMKGLVGTIFSVVNSKAVVGGTENGLANIIKLSEEAQKSS